MLIGFPGENEDDFKKTMELVERVAPYVTGYNTGHGMGIGPGMTLWDKVDQYDILLDENGQVKYDEYGNWESKDGSNTIAVRDSRLKRVRDYCKENKLFYSPQN